VLLKVVALDRSQLAQHYARFGGLVFRRARALLHEDQAAQDACQEVFFKLWQTPPDFAEVSAVAWLYRVTTNHCLNMLRDRRRQGALAAAHAAASERAVGGGVGGDTSGGVPLPLLLRGVPEHLHELAVYYYIDEMTQEEIALVLQVSQRTVCNRLKEFRTFVQGAWDQRAVEAS
jgi:RNA polymerase sigma-70 factor (ECF subfamily)